MYLILTNLYALCILLLWYIFQASLHDLIIKNIDKILKPRNANTETLY